MASAGKPWRVALVGLGKMGRNHLRVIRENPAFQLVAVVDPVGEVDAKDRCGAPLLRQISELQAIEFDAAVVATPTATHFETASEILAMGKHLLLEKPVADTFERGRLLLEDAGRRGVHLAVGHVERFNPAVRKLREVIREGWLGTLIHFSFTRVGGYPQAVVGNNNVLLDLAVHDIDVLRSLVGPVRFEASRSHATVQEDVFDTAEIFLSAQGGLSAALHVNWITPTKIRTIRVTGSRGVCFVDFILQTCELLGGRLLQGTRHDQVGFEALQQQYKATDRIEFGITKQEPLKAQLEQFDRLLATGDAGELCMGSDALAALLIAERSIAAERARPHRDPAPGSLGNWPTAQSEWV